MDVSLANEVGGSTCSLIPFQLFRLSRWLQPQEARKLWTWAAILFATAATFSALMRKMRLLVKHILTKNSLPLLFGGHMHSTIETDDSDDAVSTCSSWDDSSDDIQNPNKIGKRMRTFVGHSNLLRSFSGKLSQNVGYYCNFRRWDWPFPDGESIVKLWDGLSSGIGTERESATITSEPAVVISAEVNERRRTAVNLWDLRIKEKPPSIIAEWECILPDITQVTTGGVQKVYMNDTNGLVAVGDLRHVKAPLFPEAR